MNQNSALSRFESFSVRHAIGLGIAFLAVVFAAAGVGVLRACHADNAEQLFGHAVVMAAPAQR